MKSAKISKVLAFLLAAVMIFSALPLMAFASDEAETYTVSYGAPAIPMNEMSIVDLTDLEVEMDANGTTVSGADITWAAAEQDGIEFDASAKTVFAKKVGRYKLTATANGVTKNVWVLVKDKSADKFYLVNLPELNENTFVASDWRVFGGTNAIETTAADAVTLHSSSIETKQTVAGVNKGAGLVYFDEIFKDFADYTVESYSASGAAYHAQTVTNVGNGVVGRVQMNEAGTMFTTGIITYLRQNRVMGYIDLTQFPTKVTYSGYGNADSWDSTVQWTVWRGTSDYHSIKSVYSGSNLSFYYNDMDTALYTLTESTAKNPAVYAPDAGYPGLLGYAAGAYYKSFYVYLNSSALAPATEVSFYEVPYAAPAIPMDVNTAVNLKFVNVVMDANGTVALGEDIVWDTAESEGIYLNKDGKKVSVYAAGNYKLTATANGVTKNVWIIARASTTDDFYLVNEPVLNSNTFDASKWLLFQPKNGTVVTTSVATATNNIASPSVCMMVYVNDIFKDFADYTVEANIASNADPREAVNANRGAGLAGRLGIVDKAWDFTGVPTYIRQDYKINVRAPQAANSNKTFGSGRDIYKYDEDGNIVLGGTDGTTKLTVPELKAWENSSTYHIVKNVYSGTEVEIFYDGESLAHSKDATDANFPNRTQTAAGYPGVIGYESKALLKSFAVKLNSNEMPDAIAAEVAPVEPEAEIIITGEGDAEVEAVVGSENNYTVKLAPAEGYKVKVGSLFIDGEQIILGAEGDTTGRLYTFKSDDLNNTVISVEYIPDDGTFNSMMLGAQINESKKGIRFGSRTDFIRRNGEFGTLGDKLLVDGATYVPTEVGMLFLPSVLIDGELTVDTKNVTRHAVSKVVNLTADFSDIAITLVGIPESFFDAKISSCMYVAYEVNGETRYVYTEVIERSYNDVLAAIGK